MKIQFNDEEIKKIFHDAVRLEYGEIAFDTSYFYCGDGYLSRIDYEWNKLKGNVKKVNTVKGWEHIETYF